jgi:hypothetical protein
VELIKSKSPVTIPEVISFAENQIGFGVEGGADLAQSAVATSALETVLVPEAI